MKSKHSQECSHMHINEQYPKLVQSRPYLCTVFLKSNIIFQAMSPLTHGFFI